MFIKYVFIYYPQQMYFFQYISKVDRGCLCDFFSGKELYLM